MFNIHAKNFFLTFPEKFNKVSLDSKEIVLDLLKQLFKQVKANPNKIIVAFEESDDDHAYRHYHIYLEMDRKFRVRDPRFFDLNGVHGQYESCRSKKDAEQYAKKDGDFIEYSVSFLRDKPSCSEIVQHMLNFIRSHKGNVRDLALQCIKGFNDSQEAVFIINRRSIENAVFSALKLRNYDRLMTIKSNFKVNEEAQRVLDWLQNYKNKRTLVLIGPTGIGKTEFAKSLFSNPLLVRHKDQLKNIQLSTDGIIFDDMSFKDITTEEAIHILDVENSTSVDVKHSSVELYAGLPRIITTNKEQHEILPKDPHRALERRIFCVVFVNKLFNNDQPYLWSDQEEKNF
jgi:hypothetical protein